jgi:hypothetical protein
MRKRYNGEDGSQVDAEEAADKAYRANKPPLIEMGDGRAAEAAGQFGDAGTSRIVKATPKAASKPAPKAAPKPAAKVESKPAPKAASDDVTKMSVAERAKMSREKARAGSGTTDRRSVGERLKSAFGMKSGGSVGSASRRGDGIATKGKTKGTMVKMNYGGKC